MAKQATVSFLSDFGLKDEFVGVVKSVIWSLAPSVRIVDITHGIARHDVRAGGLALARASQYLCSGVVLAVVDPGVGGERRGVAVELDDDAATVLVGPDNGLLAPAVAMLGGASRAVALTNPKYQLPAAGDTFHGRDVFGPAAAYLCQGVPLEDLGDAIDIASLLPAVIPVPQKMDDYLMAEVLWVDQFGNAQLNVGPEDLENMGDRFALKIIGGPANDIAESLSPGLGLVGQSRSGNAAAAVKNNNSGSNGETKVKLGHKRSLVASIVSSYSQLNGHEVGLVVDSYGMFSISLCQQSASDELALYEGMSVTLTPFAGDLVEFVPRQAGNGDADPTQNS